MIFFRASIRPYAPPKLTKFRHEVAKILKQKISKNVISPLRRQTSCCRRTLPSSELVVQLILDYMATGLYGHFRISRGMFFLDYMATGLYGHFEKSRKFAIFPDYMATFLPR